MWHCKDLCLYPRVNSFSSLIIVKLHAERWCTALGKWVISWSLPLCAGVSSLYTWVSFRMVQQYSTCIADRNTKHTKFNLKLLEIFVFLSQSSIGNLPGCLYIPDRQMVAARVLWMPKKKKKKKQSGMSPSFCALLSVTLYCPDYCLLLLLFDNNITIPFDWGWNAAKRQCSPNGKENNVWEIFLFFWFFFSALSNNNKTNFNPSLTTPFASLFWHCSAHESQAWVTCAQQNHQ